MTVKLFYTFHVTAESRDRCFSMMEVTTRAVREMQKGSRARRRKEGGGQRGDDELMKMVVGGGVGDDLRDEVKAGGSRPPVEWSSPGRRWAFFIFFFFFLGIHGQLEPLQTDRWKKIKKDPCSFKLRLK